MRENRTSRQRSATLSGEALPVRRVGEGDVEGVLARADARKRSASMRCTVHRIPDAPSCSMLARSETRLGAADSTKVACAAPRESASRPSAPEPEKRSRTAAPGSSFCRCSSTPLARGRRWGARRCRAGRRSCVRASVPRRCARVLVLHARRASPADAVRRSSRRAPDDTRCRSEWTRRARSPAMPFPSRSPRARRCPFAGAA